MFLFDKKRIKGDFFNPLLEPSILPEFRPLFNRMSDVLKAICSPQDRLNKRRRLELLRSAQSMIGAH